MLHSSWGPGTYTKHVFFIFTLPVILRGLRGASWQGQPLWAVGRGRTGRRYQQCDRWAWRSAKGSALGSSPGAGQKRLMGLPKTVGRGLPRLAGQPRSSRRTAARGGRQGAVPDRLWEAPFAFPGRGASECGGAQMWRRRPRPVSSCRGGPERPPCPGTPAAGGRTPGVGAGGTEASEPRPAAPVPRPAWRLDCPSER